LLKREEQLTLFEGDLAVKAESLSVRETVVEAAKKEVAFCDRTTSRIRGLSPKIIFWDPRRSENTQTQHISMQYYNIGIQVKVIIY
jgi:hypothetical protein